MKSGIYKISNLITGRSYIGSAVVIAGRLANHRSLLRRGVHPNRYLQASWNKHGGEAFAFSTVLICSKDNLLFFEQRVIDGEEKVFNLRPVASSQLGFKHSEETRKKFQSCPQLMAGKTLSVETRAAISRGLMGHSVSEKHREATRSRFKGKKLSDAHREKLSLAKKGKLQPPELVAKRALSNTGRKRSPESLLRMKLAQQARRQAEARI